MRLAELSLLDPRVRPGRNLHASHLCQRLLASVKPGWHSVISWYCKETDIERACEDRLGNNNKFNTLLSYFTPQLSYANHSPQKCHEFITRLSPGLSIIEMQHTQEER